MYLHEWLDRERRSGVDPVAMDAFELRIVDQSYVASSWYEGDLLCDRDLQPREWERIYRRPWMRRDASDEAQTPVWTWLFGPDVQL
jgi:hypothetical protein